MKWQRVKLCTTEKKGSDFRHSLRVRVREAALWHTVLFWANCH